MEAWDQLIDRTGHWKQELHPANEVFAWLHISLRQIFVELNEIILEFGHGDQEEMEQKNLWAAQAEEQITLKTDG